MIYADVYYAKAEPAETYLIRAAASGRIVYANLKSEGKLAGNNILIQIDDTLNSQQLGIYEKTLETINARIKSLESVMRLEQDNYERIKDLRTKPKIEKDREQIEYLNAQIQMLGAKEQALGIQNQIAVEREQIRHKAVRAKDLYVYRMYVKQGDVVNVGSELMEVMDISRAKLTLYLSREDAESLAKKQILMDDTPTEYGFSSIQKVADSTNISSYEAKLLIASPDIFSKLIKIELKDKESHGLQTAR